MLVLSRRANETIEFPALGISVEILRCGSQAARVGIKAPREIEILRGEIAETSKSGVASDRAAVGAFGQAAADMQQQIGQAATVLNRLHAIADSTKWYSGDSTIMELFEQLKLINAQVSRFRGPQPEADRRRNVRALLVDDNDNESRLLASYLKIKGCEVITASDGQEALSQISAHAPDVVLLDMSMPHFDGRWTISQIRGSHELAHMPVFAVSGTCQDESGVEVGPGGVNAWYHKPLNPEMLSTEIHKCFQAAVCV